jgi:TraY domain
VNLEPKQEQYEKVFISFQLSALANRLLSESCKRSGRKKVSEAALRLEDHLLRYRAIAEIGEIVSKEEQES